MIPFSLQFARLLSLARLNKGPVPGSACGPYMNIQMAEGLAETIFHTTHYSLLFIPLHTVQCTLKTAKHVAFMLSSSHDTVHT